MDDAARAFSEHADPPGADVPPKDGAPNKDGDGAAREGAPRPSQPPRKSRVMPVLYSNPVPLSPESHGDQALAPMPGYGFAAGTNAVPLNGAQFPMAMRDYPIVFAGDVDGTGPGSGPVMALAVLGLREDENLFVDAKGRWASDSYIPAYVRRFPFIFLSSPNREKSAKGAKPAGSNYVLCVDDSAGHIIKSTRKNPGRPFFEDGKASGMTRRALEFCRTYQVQSEATKAFTAALRQHKLLKPNRARISLPSGEALSLSGFQVIDEEAFNALPADVFLAWRANGWLALVHWHFASMQNWRRLLKRAETAPGKPAPKKPAAKPAAKKPAPKKAAPRKAPKLKTGAAAAKKG